VSIQFGSVTELKEIAEDLLEALKRVTQWGGYVKDDCGLEVEEAGADFLAADAAIAKAEGK
jgi:hypothetical protein